MHGKYLSSTQRNAAIKLKNTIISITEDENSCTMHGLCIIPSNMGGESGGREAVALSLLHFSFHFKFLRRVALQ